MSCCISLPNSAFHDTFLVAWNWLSWSTYTMEINKCYESRLDLLFCSLSRLKKAMKKINLNCAMSGCHTTSSTKKDEKKTFFQYLISAQCRTISHHWQMNKVLIYVFVESFMLELYSFMNDKSNFFAESDCNQTFICSPILSLWLDC